MLTYDKEQYLKYRRRRIILILIKLKSDSPCHPGCSPDISNDITINHLKAHTPQSSLTDILSFPLVPK